jgi:hypothetical protein
LSEVSIFAAQNLRGNENFCAVIINEKANIFRKSGSLRWHALCIRAATDGQRKGDLSQKINNQPQKGIR